VDEVEDAEVLGQLPSATTTTDGASPSMREEAPSAEGRMIER
jgi:hypothetical protein